MPKKSRKCKLFLNFTPCGYCGKDCSENSHSIFCDICCKWFHRKCQKLTIKQYNELSVDPNLYVCSEKCELSIFPFTHLDHIEFKSTIFGDGLSPCTICSYDCLDGMDCLQCDVCDEWFHTECRYGRFAGDNDGFTAHEVIVDNNYEAMYEK